MSERKRMTEREETLLRRFCGWVNGEPARDRSRYIHTHAGGRAAVAKAKEKAEARVRARDKADDAEDRRVERFEYYYHVFAVIICLCFVGTMLVTVFGLPLFGAPNNPASNEVVARYVEDGLAETGAVNIVAGMILDYRAFDTFGESSVLFIAVTSVMMLLLRDKNNTSAEEDAVTAHEYAIERETGDVIPQKIILLLLPCILLFGAYVVLNGQISPGGGFSGGSIMGAGLIVYASGFGTMAVRRFFTRRTFTAVTTAALLTYALSKAYAFFTGAYGLPSGIPLGTPGALLSGGLIFVLDICVGLIVACTMYGFYALFARGRL